MGRRALFLFSVLILSQVGAPYPGMAQELSSLEKNVFNELNEMRANPKDYVKKLEAILPLFRGNLIKFTDGTTRKTREGAKAVKEAIKALKKTRPLSRLALSTGLSRSALEHVQDHGPKGLTGHKGSNGSDITERASRFGVWRRSLGENISYGMSTAQDVVWQLLIDDGVKSRGHRHHLLQDGFNKVGISCGEHKRYRTMCVMDFAGDYLESGPGTATMPQKPLL